MTMDDASRGDMAQGKRAPLHARIGDRLRRARRERDLSQRRLGELAGLYALLERMSLDSGSG